ncbi:MAG: hypothetical protein ABIH55_00260 [Nanoarchaeota archaeon]
MEDFMWVLAAAFVIIVAMLFVSLIVPIDTTPKPDEIIEIDTMIIGAVGRISGEPVTTMRLGSFNVGETQTELLKAVPQMRVYSGIAGSESKKYEIEVTEEFLDLMSDIVIDFDVFDSNAYGDLVVKWNGAVFLRDKAARRDYTITIAKEYVKTVNNLEIYADGPGIMFWASTEYVLKDFNVDLNYGPSKIFAFQLSQDDLEAWSKGRVTYYATGTSGMSGSKLIVKVNGYEIHSEKPNGQGVAEFQYSDAPMKIGDNILTFAAKDDMIIMHNTELSLYLSTTELAKTSYFDISNEEYALIQSGQYKIRLRFNIDDILSGGTLNVKVNGHQRAISAMTVGSNLHYLTQQEIEPGTNVLGLSGTGSWYIGKASVELEKV